MTERDQERRVFDTAAGAGFDTRPYSIVLELKRILGSIKDEDTAIDSGTSERDADLWVTIGGVEYYINVRASNSQLLKEGHSRESLGLPPIGGDGTKDQAA